VRLQISTCPCDLRRSAFSGGRPERYPAHRRADQRHGGEGLSDRDAVDRYAFDVRWRHPVPTGRQVLAEHRGQQGGGLPTDSPSVRLVTIVTDTGAADGAPAGLGRSCPEKPRPGNDGITR